MAFIEARLNDDLVIYDTIGGPRQLTTIVRLPNGQVIQRPRWSGLLGRWEIGERRVTKAELSELHTFWHVMKVNGSSFRFKDWGDFEGVDEGIGIGDGSLKTFQLVKTYTVGAASVQRTIHKPVADTVKPYIDSVLQPSGFSVDTTTGIVTFTTAPGIGEVVSADFEFDVPVFFPSDTFNAQFEVVDKASGEQFHYLSSLPVEEVRL